MHRPARWQADQGPDAQAGQADGLRPAHPARPVTDPFIGTQEAVPGTRMPTLAEVFQLADRYGAGGVQFNIETKLDPTLTSLAATPSSLEA